MPAWKQGLLLLLLPILLIGQVYGSGVTVVPNNNLTSIDSNTQIDSGLTIGFNGPYSATLSEAGICFKPTTMNLKQVKFNMVVAAGSPLGTFNAQLFASTGTIGTNCQPTGSSLATSNSLSIGVISGDTSFFVFSSYFDLQAGTTYAVSIRLISCLRCDSSNYWSVEYVNTDITIHNNIYYWNNPYAVGGPNSKLKYEIDGSPIVQFKNAYGYIDVTATESFAGIGPITRLGPFYFNVSGFEPQIGIYYLTVVPYGNGTLILRFPGITPFQVVHSLSSIATYDTSNKWESLTYTTSQTDPVQVMYVGSVKSNIQNSAWGLAAIFGIIGLVVGILWIKMDLEQPEHIATLNRKKDLVRAVILMCIAIMLMFSMAALFT